MLPKQDIEAPYLFLLRKNSRRSFSDLFQQESSTEDHIGCLFFQQ